MDPSIMKKLLEDDEDESMHSGADVDAFQAALNRDIGGDAPPAAAAAAASHSYDSDSAPGILSQGSNNTSSQSLPQFQTGDRDENANYEVQQDQKTAQQEETNLSEKEVVKPEPTAENVLQQQHNNVLQEVNDAILRQTQSQGDYQQRQAELNHPQIPQATGMQIPGKNPIKMHEPDRPHNPDNESQYLKLQKMSNLQSTVVEQASNPPARSKQVPFGLLLPVLMNQLDKDKGMQLQELFGKLKKEEISKESFVRLIRSVVGEQVLRLAVMTVQAQNLQPSPKQYQLQSQASMRKLPPGMPSVSSGPSQFADPRSFSQVHQKGTSSSADASHAPSSAGQLQTNPSHLDSHGMQASQMPSSSAGATNQERDSMQGLNKQQQQQQPQQLHFPQTSFSTYGGNGSNSHLYSGTNVNTSTLPLKLQSHDAQIRQIPQHQSMGSAQLGGETQGTNMLSLPKLERQNSINDPSRMQGGSLPHFASNLANRQKLAPWQQSTSKDQNAGPLSSMSYVKPETVDQAIELQHKPPPPNSQGLPSISSVHIEQGNMSSGASKDESLEKHHSRMGFSNSASIVPLSSTSMAPHNTISSSMSMQLGPSIPSGARAPSGTPPPGNNSKTPPKKPSTGQKKPLEAVASSPSPANKKQKVSGNFSDQSIEQLNDVTAVSGVNLREEEEQLFSGPKEDTRVSEASRKAVQEEEERLILQKTPLQKKLAEIMVKCGLKSVSNDVERCLSLSVEERMRGLIDNLIRLSKQRVDAEKSRHRTITTSDIQLQIMTVNRKAKEEWEKKQTEAEKLRKQNEPESNNEGDVEKEKDEGRAKPLKMQANKEEDDKMRTTAANVAARAAVGGDDMLSKWQMMAEQARQKREGGPDAASDPQAGKDVNRKPSSAPGRTMKDQQGDEKRSSAASFAAPVHGVSVARDNFLSTVQPLRPIWHVDGVPILEDIGAVRKFGRNQVIVAQTSVARSITVKDVIAVLEREPQLSRSTLIYRLYEKIKSDTTGE